MEKLFTGIANAVAHAAGKPATFVICCAVIVAWALFLLIKGMNSLKRQEAATPPPPAPPTKTEVLLEEIRDLLKR